ncbi:MAG: RHS repeat domain-containing protein [Chthoniobacterales bacterium]
MELRLLLPQLAAVSLLLYGGTLRVQAELGDQNPTGISGQFNGNVTTGGSYDPYTGNATRSITDIVVPGAVGAYPLDFTRTLNTRNIASEPAGGSGQAFGAAGGWRHSYQWTIERRVIPGTCDESIRPGGYSVHYPDGRRVTFGGDPNSTEPFRPLASGISDRFQPIEQDNPHSCYLLLADGGKIWFEASITPERCPNSPGTTGQLTFDYTLSGVIDPYGQVTMIDGGIDSHGEFRVDKITEPGGRNLTLWYSEELLNSIEERLVPDPTVTPKRVVRYGYSIQAGGSQGLTSVNYFDDPSLTATYTYQPSNTSSNPVPLIETCDDTMYPGAMSRIRYEFMQGGDYGQLHSEKRPDGTLVSQLDVTTGNTRMETRGDEATRTFTYTGGLLTAWTDFMPSPNTATWSQGHGTGNLTGFVTSATDPRGQSASGYVTNFGRDAMTGKVTSITYPATPSDENGTGGTRNIGYESLFYIANVSDERGKLTTYQRDQYHRIFEVDYPQSDYETSAPYESFGYTALGQVAVHMRRNGFYDHFLHDERGLLKIAWNPLPGAGQPDPAGPEAKTVFTYYPVGDVWQDRVQTVTDARSHTTQYEYERSPDGTRIAGRGLVSKVINPDTTFRKFFYNSLGDTVRVKNERQEPVEYDRDDYRRLTEVRTPLPDAEHPWARTNYDYTPAEGISAYARTASAPTTVTGPTTVTVHNGYDADIRLETTTHDNPGGVAATTTFHYDLAGNRDWIVDPRSYQTDTEYDQRNRKTTVTSPPISAAANARYVTQWFYDPASNVRKIILPDSTTGQPREITREYDAMNRLWHSWDQMNRLTTTTYSASGMVKSVLDPKMHLTQFDYNERDLKKTMTYPDAATTGEWKYDSVGNLTERPTIGGPRQLFHYDERNRLAQMRWSNAIDSSDFGYDEVGRLTSAMNPNSTITRAYDVGGRMTFDRQAFVTVPAPPNPPVEPVRAVSRKSHGSAGFFDLNLPLSGTTAVECRSGGTSGSHQLVMTFPVPVTLSGAKIVNGTATVADTSVSGNDVTIDLSDVNDAQFLSVRLNDVSDGSNTGDVVVSFRLLFGDTNGDGTVNTGDRLQTAGRQGQPLSAANFRSDVNMDGAIDSTDVDLVRAEAGSGLPAAPPAGPVVEVSYEHDAEGKRTRLSVPGTDYDFGYGYDGMGRLQNIFYRPDPNPSPYYQYEYDQSSNVTLRRSLLNVTEQRYTPDEINRMTERAIAIPDPAQPGMFYDLSHEHYGLDPQGRLQTLYREEDQLSDIFDYNPAGELREVKYGAEWDGTGYVNEHRKVNYHLDDAGNREGLAGVDENGNQLAYTPDLLNQYTVANSNPVANGSQHELTDHAGVQYQYIGDTHLSSATSAAGTYQAGYDALGRLVRRTTNGQPTFYAFDGPHAIMEYNPGGTVIANSLYGKGMDELIARNNYGQEQFFHQDRLGNVSAVTGPYGVLLEQYRYDAYGKPTFIGPRGVELQRSRINNRFLFTGREWVQNYGFYEFRARAYNPRLGRFMSEDPMGFAAGDANLFRYCAGDPVNFVDPSGLFEFGEFARGAANVALGSIEIGAIAFGEAPTFGMITLGLPLAVGQFSIGVAQVVESFARTDHLADQMIADPYHAFGAMLPSSGGRIVSAALGGYSVYGGASGVWNGEPYWRNAINIGSGIWDIGEAKLDNGPGSDRITVYDAYGRPYDGGMQVNVMGKPVAPPSFGGLHVDNTFNSPGHGSGLNYGSSGGAPASVVLSTLFQTLVGVPGGGGQPGEGSHPVPFDKE